MVTKMFQIDNILDVEKYIDDVDAVIFDLDDTLYSEKDYVWSGYKKISEYFDVPELFDEMWQVFKNGGKAIDEVLEKHRLLSGKDEALHIYRFQQPDIRLYPGVQEMISRIRMKKKVGIITDGRPEGQRAKIQALGVNVDEIIITDELGGIEFRKPNVVAFRIMQERLKVPFDKMVYIGDNPRKDFVGPKKMGMKSIYFRNLNGLYSV